MIKKCWLFLELIQVSRDKLNQISPWKEQETFQARHCYSYWTEKAEWSDSFLFVCFVLFKFKTWNLRPFKSAGERSANGCRPSFSMNSNRNAFREQQSYTFNSQKRKLYEGTGKSARIEELTFFIHPNEIYDHLSREI